MMIEGAGKVDAHFPAQKQRSEWDMKEDNIHPSFSESYYLNQLKLI